MRKPTILLPLLASIIFASSCSLLERLPQVKCESTQRIPVTTIKGNTAHTVYVPYCDTVRILPPKQGKKTGTVDSLKLSIQ